MPPYITDVFISTLYALEWAVGFFLLFGTLSHLFPCNLNSPKVSRGLQVDLTYLIVMPIFSRIVMIAYLTVGANIVFYGADEVEITHSLMHGYGPLGTLPVWLQAAIAFMASDLILYWGHRLFHGRTLWRFHAIHHAPTTVDWHTCYRFHPINTWLAFTLVDTIMVLSGLSIQSIAVLATFNALYSAMVHANLNWTFGPFKYILASPVFHRWHHTLEEEGMNKNFAPTFSLLDALFGTFYMPEGRLPEHYGISGNPVPETFLGQLVWPFTNKQ